MGAKPKARKTAAKKSAQEKQKEQSARFIEAAREHNVDETGKEFEQALTKVVRTTPVKPS
jgi:hypothetical protein